MTGFDCASVDQHGAEYALGLLDGEERAAVIAHLDGCARCRTTIAELADVADGTLLIAPDAEPPAGFEERVLETTSSEAAGRRPRSARRWRRRVGSVAAVAALVLAVAVAAVWYGRSGHGPESADVRSRSGQTVGRVVVTADDPGWMFLSLQGGQVKGAYSCELALADGTVVPLGEFDSKDGQAGWSGTIPVRRQDILEMRVLLPDGRVVATADLR